MCQLVLVLLAVVAGYAGAATIERCCTQKMVGGVNYTLVDDTKSTAKWGCHSDCVFERVGMEGSRFCFKSGDLEVVCEEDYPGVCQCQEVEEYSDYCAVTTSNCSDWTYPACSFPPPNCGGCRCLPVQDDDDADINAIAKKCPITANSKFTGALSATKNPVDDAKACQTQCKNNPSTCTAWAWDGNGAKGDKNCLQWQSTDSFISATGWTSGTITPADCTL